MILGSRTLVKLGRAKRCTREMLIGKLSSIQVRACKDLGTCPDPSWTTQALQKWNQLVASRQGVAQEVPLVRNYQVDKNQEKDLLLGTNSRTPDLEGPSLDKKARSLAGWSSSFRTEAERMDNDCLGVRTTFQIETRASVSRGLTSMVRGEVTNTIVTMTDMVAIKVRRTIQPMVKDNHSKPMLTKMRVTRSWDPTPRYFRNYWSRPAKFRTR